MRRGSRYDSPTSTSSATAANPGRARFLASGRFPLDPRQWRPQEPPGLTPSRRPPQCVVGPPPANRGARPRTPTLSSAACAPHHRQGGHPRLCTALRAPRRGLHHRPCTSVSGRRDEPRRARHPLVETGPIGGFPSIVVAQPARPPRECSITIGVIRRSRGIAPSRPELVATPIGGIQAQDDASGDRPLEERGPRKRPSLR